MKLGDNLSPREMKPQNAENLFVHRLQHAGLPGLYGGDARPPATATYWKSPYAGETVRQKGICIKPELTVSSKQSTSAGTQKTDRTEEVNVKGILKSTDKEHKEEKAPISARSAFRKLNAISAGTRRSRPVTSVVVGKRVQFVEKLQQENAQVAAANKHKSRSSVPQQSTSKYAGRYRSVYLGRSVDQTSNAKHIYGPVEMYRSPGHRSDRRPPSNDGSGNGRHISVFIRRIKVPDRSQQDEGENRFFNKIAQQRTADKLRMPLCLSGTSRVHVSAEKEQNSRLNTEREQSNVQANNSTKSYKHVTKDKPSEGYNVYRARQTPERTRQYRSSDEDSFSSFSDDNVTMTSQKGGKLARPKTMASLYTRYGDAHSSRAKEDPKAIETSFHKLDGTEDPPGINFCDNGKTSQILGWLQQVRSARSSERKASVSSLASSDKK